MRGWIPEPLQKLSESGYVVGVEGVHDDAYGYYEELRIKPEYISETNEYSLIITAPIEGDVLITWDISTA